MAIDFKKRNNTTTQQTTSRTQERHQITDIRSFIMDTYKLFAGSLMGGAIGAYVGLHFAPAIKSAYWLFVILEFALIFGVYAVKRKPGLNLAMLFAFTFVSGLTLAPLLSLFLFNDMGGVVAQAFLLTSVAFGGLTLFAMRTDRDYTTMGKMLFIALIVLVAAAILNIFMQSSLLQIIIASVGAILFSFFILYDTQNIIQGNYETAVEGALALYIDFLNLFVSLLQILGIFGGDD